MAKVTIKGLKTRTMAKDKKSATPLHKSKPSPAKAYMKPPTVSQDKAYNSKQM
jgi:hypothetical protein